MYAYETNYREVSCFYAFLYFQFFLCSFLSSVHASFLLLCFQRFCHFLANYSQPSFFPILTLTLHFMYFFSLFFYTFIFFVTPCLVYSFIVSSQRCRYLELIYRPVLLVLLLEKGGCPSYDRHYVQRSINSCKWNSINVCPLMVCSRFFNIWVNKVYATA
jgi:hypothetical protein